MDDLPQADAVPVGTDIEKLKRVISERSLGGLSNNTKWNELISSVRKRHEWKPSYRSKYITGHISGWDTEWFYHLPFPFIGVEWFDISLLSNNKQSPDWLIPLVETIGFEFEVRGSILRIWGYAPKSYEEFPDENA